MSDAATNNQARANVEALEWLREKQWYPKCDGVLHYMYKLCEGSGEVIDETHDCQCLADAIAEAMIKELGI